MKKTTNMLFTKKAFKSKWGIEINLDDKKISLKWLAFKNYEDGTTFAYHKRDDGYIYCTVIADHLNGNDIQRERKLIQFDNFEEELKKVKSFKSGIELIRKIDKNNYYDLENPQREKADWNKFWEKLIKEGRL